MKTAYGVVLGILACAIAALSLPAAAGAAGRSSREVQIGLRGSNGYGIEVAGEVAGSHSTVTLSVERPFRTASYSTEGTVTADRIKASFGSLGYLDLHLSAARKRQVEVPRSCKQPDASSRLASLRTGVFSGTLRFKGEQGFTTISSHHVRGAVGEPLALVISSLPNGESAHLICLHRPQNATADETGKAVVLQAASPGGDLSLEAISEPVHLLVPSDVSSGRLEDDEGVIQLLAVDSERKGNVAISRSVVMPAPGADLTVDEGLGSAILMPPAPFSGRGEFRRNPDGTTSWSGSLSVSFPGAENVPLIGPGFIATLGHGATF